MDNNAKEVRIPVDDYVKYIITVQKMADIAAIISNGYMDDENKVQAILSIIVQ